MRKTLDSRRRTAIAAAVLVCALGLFLGVAVSASGQQEGVIETTGPVHGDKCDPCHANIGRVIIPGKLYFEHGFHLLVECSACHTDFPHKPDVTSRPPMKTCWACHKLTHGSGGEIARGNCSACHLKEFMQKWSCPFSKRVKNWSGKGHAKLGKLLQKKDCAMCHQPNFCRDCHKGTGAKVQPVAAHAYDEGTDCLVCHQVKTLSKTAAEGKRRSFFVSKEELDKSVHAERSCQGCHADFNFLGRGTSASYKFVASLACQDCHPKQRDIYRKSIHGELARHGRQTSATCGACHGGHDIFKLDEEGKARLATMSEQVCGDCHKDRYRNYDDYYHGAAYKTGAPDAPDCWACHGAHDVLPSKYAASKVSSVNLATTCSACKPHDNAKEDFTSYAKLIHRSQEIRSSTFIAQVLEVVRSWLPL